MITIICDCCKRELESEDLIILGSENNSLRFKRPKTGNGVIELNRYYDLHFCGKTCFVEYFFGKETETTL